MRQRIIALLLIGCVSLGPPAGADPAPFAVGALDPYRIQIPTTAGQVEEVFVGQMDKPTVVLIENAHTNYKAQISIKKILHELVDRHHFELVQIEGAATKFNPLMLQASYSEDANQKALEYLLREGRITGADAFAAETTQEVSFFGIEEEATYMENLKLFRSIYRDQKATERFLNRLRVKIEAIGRERISPAHMNLIRANEAFSSRQHGIIEHLELLKRLAALGTAIQYPQTFGVYPNLSRLARIKEIEGKINADELKKEKGALSQVLHHDKAKAYLDHDELSENPRTFFDWLTTEAEAARVDFIAKPQIRLDAERRIFQDEIDYESVYPEIKKYMTQLEDALFRAEEEKAYLGLAKSVDFLARLLKL